MSMQKSLGFSLLELMIVAAIIAILAMIAYPNYSRYGFRSRRVEGQQLLTSVAAAQERYFTVYNKYTSSVTGAAPAGLGFGSATSEHGYYSVAVDGLGANNTSYTLTATPLGVQIPDACGSLTLNNTGAKAPASGTMPQNSNGNCW